MSPLTEHRVTQIETVRLGSRRANQPARTYRAPLDPVTMVCLATSGGGRCRHQPPDGRVLSFELGTSKLRQLDRIPRITLGSGGTPPRPGRVEGVRVHGHHRVTGGKKPLHDQPCTGFDPHRQLCRRAQPRQPLQRRREFLLTMCQPPARHQLPPLIGDRHTVRRSRPVPTNLHLRPHLQRRRSPPVSRTTPAAR